jgi:energy-coupling factor transporter ATP-binding protein EcfA2
MKLELTNFKRYAAYSIEFPNYNMTLLQGESGIGKTTLFEATKWCLYGGKECIYPKGIIGTHTHQTKVKIELTELDMPGSDEHIIITRSKPPDNVEIFIPNYGTLSGVQAQSYINRIFGSKNVWISTSYLGQSERCPLMSLPNVDKFQLLQDITFGTDITQNINSKDKPQWYLDKCDLQIKDQQIRTKELTDQYNGILTVYNKQFEISKQHLSLWDGICPVINQITEIEVQINDVESKIGVINTTLVNNARISGQNQSIETSIQSFKTKLDLVMKGQFEIRHELNQVVDINSDSTCQLLTLGAEYSKIKSKIDTAVSQLLSIDDLEVKSMQLSQCHTEIAKYSQQLDIITKEESWCLQKGLIYTQKCILETIGKYKNQISINNTLLDSQEKYLAGQRQLLLYQQDQERRSKLNTKANDLQKEILHQQTPEYKPIQSTLIEEDITRIHVHLQQGNKDKQICQANNIQYVQNDIDNAIKTIVEHISDYDVYVERKVEFDKYILLQKKHTLLIEEHTNYTSKLNNLRLHLDTLRQHYKPLIEKWQREPGIGLYPSIEHVDSELTLAKSIIKFNLQCPHCEGHLSYDPSTQNLKGIKASLESIISAKENIENWSSLKVGLQEIESCRREIHLVEKDLSHRDSQLKEIQLVPVVEPTPPILALNEAKLPAFKSLVSHLQTIKCIDIDHLNSQLEIHTKWIQWVQKNQQLYDELNMVNKTLETLGETVIEPPNIEAPSAQALNQNQIQDLISSITVMEQFYFFDREIITHKLITIQNHIRQCELINDIDTLRRQMSHFLDKISENDQVIINNLYLLGTITPSRMEQLAHLIQQFNNEISMIKTEILNLQQRLISVQSSSELELKLINLQAEIKYQRLKYEAGKYLITMNESYKGLQSLHQKINESMEEETDLIKLRSIINDTSSKALQDTVDSINNISNYILADLFTDPISIELKLYKEVKTTQQVKSQVNLEINYRGMIYTSLEGVSGGERDRISIAMTLALNQISSSPFIFLDECMSSLRGNAKTKCSRNIQKHGGSRTIVNICHDISEGYHSNVIEFDDPMSLTSVETSSG